MIITLILVAILTILCISLRTIRYGLNLSHSVSERGNSIRGKGDIIGNIDSKEVLSKMQFFTVRVILNLSISSVSLLRNILCIVWVIVGILQLFVLLLIVCVVSYLLLLVER